MKLQFYIGFLCTSFTLISSQNSSETGTDGASFRKPLSQPEVCAECGCVRGKFESGRKKSYDAFYGIPYAEPPVGKLRFESPVPYSGWTGYWDASYPRDDCLQENLYLPGYPISGSEDCLFLNVYRPSSWNRKKKLPVLIWIHMGSFFAFSSNPALVGPEYLMDNGEVILVTMNYRLGILGFLCSGDEAVKGNFGLKDQQLALKWVATNIEYFGGDSSSITLAGHGAGGISTNLHMLNPKSQALFHRAIMMSGVALTPMIYPIDFEAQFRKVAKLIELPDWEAGTTTNLAYQMKKLDGLKLILAHKYLFLMLKTPPFSLRPCIEGDWEGAFMTEDPRTVWAEGRFVHKPFVVGTVRKEGIVQSVITTDKSLLDQFNKNIYHFLPVQLDFHPKYAYDVMKYYLGKKDYIDSSNQAEYFEMYGDRCFCYPMVTMVNQYITYADVKKNPVFIYEFAYESEYSLANLLHNTEEYLGVGQLDDLPYLFRMSSNFQPFETDSPESRMSDIWVRTMVNFVARGEIKVWRTLRPCTTENASPTCDRQVFERYTNGDQDESFVSIANNIDTDMLKLFENIDSGVKSKTLESCTLS
ncbi:juvenile hormone esterase-like [Phlebotomus papatasi]|uniref:juvenile hormone esterase-like n=1 Tax=Phlebotomus papatasi TaxID=29031 RepID=UPI002483A84F|nr:juvenile hormone esterase-like [Phlebotomus papatasi]